MNCEKSQILAARIARVREEMERHGTDGLLLTKAENKIYLSMFESSSFGILLTRTKNYLLTDFRYIEAASQLAPLYEVIMVTAEYTLYNFLREMDQRGDIDCLGLEYSSLSVSEYSHLREFFQRGSFQDISGLVERCRIVKDDWELANIRQAARIADEAFSYILGEIRPGVSEKEIAWLLERRMREKGASGLSFDTICAAGVRSSMPHAHPTEELIQNGDFVTMDFGCVYNGYCSDMTRTVAVGRVSDEQREIYDIVWRAQKAACEVIRPGLTGRQIDAAARDLIAAEGYGDCFGHSLGHGVGLEIHEAPTASPRSSEVFEKNMLITIEPGIYLPKKFGVRIEDLSIVEDSAIINLVMSQKELIIL